VRFGEVRNVQGGVVERSRWCDAFGDDLSGHL
jgi:hypothetical protein